jgi:hypothetical protein
LGVPWKIFHDGSMQNACRNGTIRPRFRHVRRGRYHEICRSYSSAVRDNDSLMSDPSNKLSYPNIRDQNISISEVSIVPQLLRVHRIFGAEGNRV